MLHVVCIVVVVSDRMRSLIIYEILELLLSPDFVLSELELDVLLDLLAYIVFHADVLQGFAHEDANLAGDLVDMVFCNVWPLARPMMEKLGEET